MQKIKRFFASLLTLMLLMTVITALTPTLTKAYAKEIITYYCDDETVPFEEQDFGQSRSLLRGGGSYYNETVTVTYDYKTVEMKNVMAPVYSNPSGLSTACAPVAGAMVAGYYDRWSVNLIPNVTPGYVQGNGIYYYFDDSVNRPAKTALFNDLYAAMGTDVNGAGTSQGEFFIGLSSYSGGKGYSMSYGSIWQSNTMVNINSMGSYLDQGKVFVLFCSTYNFIYSKTETSTSTSIFKRNSTAGHVLFASGYTINKYYRNGANFQTDYFLHVASGFSTCDEGYIKLNDYLTLDAAYMINIY